MISAGQKAKGLATELPLISHTKSKNLSPHENTGCVLSKTNDKSEENMPLIANKEYGIDNQLLAVEEGLRELVKLKVEEAVLLKISQNQNPTLIWLGLSREQAQDIQFKQSWLVYYWSRAHFFGVAKVEDVAAERLLYWMNQTNKPLSYQDVVSVQRGLWELRNHTIDNLGRLEGFASQNSLHQHQVIENVENFHQMRTVQHGSDLLYGLL